MRASSIPFAVAAACVAGIYAGVRLRRFEAPRVVRLVVMLTTAATVLVVAFAVTGVPLAGLVVSWSGPVLILFTIGVVTVAWMRLR